MSVFTEVSKKIGWASKPIQIPTVEEAQLLLEKVRDKKDKQAFETVFKLHRFAPCPVNHVENDAMLIIWDAFNLGMQIFKQ